MDYQKVKYERARMDIVRAAAGVFKAKGFHAASVDDIASACGMTKGNLYYYFKSKSDIHYFIHITTSKKLLLAAIKVSSMNIRRDTKIYLLCMHHLHCILDEVYGADAHIEFGAFDKYKFARILGLRNKYERILRSWIDEGIEMGLFRPLDSKMAGFAILGALNWAARWYKPGGEFTPAQVGKEFAEIFVRGMLKAGREPRVPDKKLFDEVVSAVKSQSDF